MKVPDAIRWHIKFKENSSKEEATHIIRIIKFFERKLKEKYFSILDVACGNGRLHSFLRNAGFEVFGIDNSNELIEEAKEKYPKFRNNYHRADMRNFNLNRKFDIALSWFTSFGYFDDKNNFKVLKNIAKHLRKNGLFLLDIPNAPIRISHIRSAPNSILIYKNFVEITNNKVKNFGKQTFWILKQNFYLKRMKDLKFVKQETKKVRIYSAAEISKLLKWANLKIIKVLNSRTLKQVDNTSTQMLIISKKL